MRRKTVLAKEPRLVSLCPYRPERLSMAAYHRSEPPLAALIFNNRTDPFRTFKSNEGRILLAARSIAYLGALRLRFSRHLLDEDSLTCNLVAGH